MLYPSYSGATRRGHIKISYWATIAPVSIVFFLSPRNNFDEVRYNSITFRLPFSILFLAHRNWGTRATPCIPTSVGCACQNANLEAPSKQCFSTTNVSLKVRDARVPKTYTSKSQRCAFSNTYVVMPQGFVSLGVPRTYLCQNIYAQATNAFI